MIGRATASLVLVAAMFAASERSVSATCILASARSQKACAPACCANKSCCQTSQKRAGDPAQPLATTSSQQQNFVALAQLVSSGSVERPRPREISRFSIAEYSWHSPETLALLCIRLI